jgi:hypothetical protein
LAPGRVTRTNESSMSRFEEREFRFVEPKRVRTGGDVGVGEIQMPLKVA